MIEKKLTNKQVQEFLISNPDFLSGHPEVLKSLEVIHDSGGAVSLIQRQVEILRANYNATTSNLLNLLTVAKNNEDIFSQTKQLVIKLIDCRTASEIVEVTEKTFEKQFNANKCQVLFFKEQKNLPKGRFKELKLSHKSFGDLYNAKDIYCGPLAKDQAQFIFGKSTKVIECALVPLRNSECPGVLALGSNINGKYDSTKDTLFLDFVAEVLNKLIEKSIK
jgi:uncharacterized protein YigA (DUF484 family)